MFRVSVSFEKLWWSEVSLRAHSAISLLSSSITFSWGFLSTTVRSLLIINFKLFQFVLFAAFVAICNAGIANYNGATVIAPTVTSESQNVYRSHGNLQQVSYNSKTIDTPYSSVSKHDVRVSNPGIAVSHQPTYTAYHHAPAAHGIISFH